MMGKSIFVMVIAILLSHSVQTMATVVIEPLEGLLLTYDGGLWIDANTVVLGVNEVLELGVELDEGHGSVDDVVEYILSNSSARFITYGGFGYGPVEFPCPFCYIEEVYVDEPQHVNFWVNNDFCGWVPGPCVMMQNLLVRSLEAKPVELDIIGKYINIDDKSYWDVVLHTLLIVPKVELLAPNGEEALMAGSTYTICWNSIAEIIEVLIEYSTNNGLDWATVNPPNVGNTGSYEWNPVPAADSNECLVRISDADDPNVYDTSDDIFTIFECQGPIIGDLNEDCYVDVRDLAVFVKHWLEGMGN